tara:strand:+ start:1335 stop:2345 length:1011 start_codon:yes stop_codon:yes gene_type:complete
MRTSGLKKVAVLMGGWSGEREVSLVSGEGALKGLCEKGYDVFPIDVTRDMNKLLKDLSFGPDVIFMGALHGRWVEDGCLQGLLEILGIPYTHSGPAASAIAMDKALSRNFFERAGLPIARGALVSQEDFRKKKLPLEYPCVLKPIAEGSSLGVHILESDKDLEDIEDIWAFGPEALLEQYIPGHEIQVAVLGGKALGAIEICPYEGFYDYKAKYTNGCAQHLMPAPLEKEVYQEVLSLAEKAHDCLQCEGVSRVDFRYNDTLKGPQGFFLLEVNTQPGLTPLSLVPEIAQHAGMSYNDLLEWMVENPRCHEKVNSQNPDPDHQQAKVVGKNTQKVG